MSSRVLPLGLMKSAWLARLVPVVGVCAWTSCAGAASTPEATLPAPPGPPRNVLAIRTLSLPDGQLALDGQEAATVECASVEPRVCHERAQAALAVDGGDVDERRAFAMVHQACLQGFQPSCAAVHGPTAIDGGSPRYTEAARRKRVQGTVRVSCTLPAKVGIPSGCAIGQSIPELDAAVLTYLSETHFQPVTFFGRPVQTVYEFTFRFSLSP